MNNKFQYSVSLMMVCLTVSLTSICTAHQIWIAKSKETDKVNIYFGEDPSPDQDKFLAGIKDMQIWSVDEKGVATSISATHKTDNNLGWFETPAGLSAVEANCQYGVFGRGDKNMFLHYCAKWIDYSRHPGSSSTGNLPLDVTMSTAGSKTMFKVLYRQSPAAGCELRIVDSEQQQHELVCDDSGSVNFDSVPSGRWLVTARLVKENPGEFQGEKYADKRFFCTMVVDAPTKPVSKQVEKTVTSSKAGSTAKLTHSTPFPELPFGITSFGGAVIGDQLYVFGGHSGDAHDYYRDGQNGKLMRLNLSSPKSWEEVCESTGLQGLAMVQHDGKLYRVGGFAAHNRQGEDQDLHSVNEFARFNFDTGKWEPLQPMPAARSSMDAVVVGDTLFVVGGWTMKGQEETVWCDDALSINLAKPNASWQVIKTPFRRRALSVGFQGHKLYAVGGMQKQGGPTTDVQIYDTSTQTWSDGPALPGDSPMAGFGSSCFNVGGRLMVSTYDGSVLQLNQEQTGWEKIHQLETGRFFHRLLPLADDKFLLVGGANMDSGKIVDISVLSLN